MADSDLDMSFAAGIKKLEEMSKEKAGDPRYFHYIWHNDEFAEVMSRHIDGFHHSRTGATFYHGDRVFIVYGRELDCYETIVKNALAFYKNDPKITVIDELGNKL